MRRNVARYVTGYGVTVLVGVLLEYLRRRAGGVVPDILAPMNASAWEMGKLCFWPYLAGALVIWRLGDGEDSRGGHCVLLVAMPLVMTALCVAFPGGAAIWRVMVPALGIALYALVLRRHLRRGEVLWYTLAILLGIAYLLLTAAAPQRGIFMEVPVLPTVAIPV